LINIACLRYLGPLKDTPVLLELPLSSVPVGPGKTAERHGKFNPKKVCTAVIAAVGVAKEITDNLFACV
jgi:hypothetical protein